MGAETTNGDGFGLGEVHGGRPRQPGPLPQRQSGMERRQHARSCSPSVAAVPRSHSRRVGSPVQQTNCHPFRHGRWLFVHGGMLGGFRKLRRDLLLAVDPQLFEGIAGSADSEVLFYLALSFGLEEDPLGAFERAIGLVERRARRVGSSIRSRGRWVSATENSSGRLRYSSEHRSRTLFVSEDVSAVRALHPDNPPASGTLRRNPAGRVRAAGRHLRGLARGAQVDSARGPARLPRGAPLPAPAP